MFGKIPRSRLLYSSTPRAKASIIYKAYEEEFSILKESVFDMQIYMIKMTLPIIYYHLNPSEYWYAFPLSHSFLLFLFKDDL